MATNDYTNGSKISDSVVGIERVDVSNIEISDSAVVVNNINQNGGEDYFPNPQSDLERLVNEINELTPIKEVRTEFMYLESPQLKQRAFKRFNSIAPSRHQLLAGEYAQLVADTFSEDPIVRKVDFWEYLAREYVKLVDEVSFDEKSTIEEKFGTLCNDEDPIAGVDKPKRLVSEFTTKYGLRIGTRYVVLKTQTGYCMLNVNNYELIKELSFSDDEDTDYYEFVKNNIEKFDEIVRKHGFIITPEMKDFIQEH